jgi:hypothetical protein
MSERIQFIKKILGIDKNQPEKYIDQGSWQKVYSLGEKWVLKTLKPENFSLDSYNIKDKKSVEKMATRLAQHTKFLRNIFGDLYPKPRVFAGIKHPSENDDVQEYLVYKMQRNLNSMTLPYYITKGGGLPNQAWTRSVLNDTENTLLKSDFQNLYIGWKLIRESGLSLDISFSKNISIVLDNGGKPRLKIFDSIPLVLIDKDKYNSSNAPQDLITVEPDKDHKTIIDSEELFEFLESYFDVK